MSGPAYLSTTPAPANAGYFINESSIGVIIFLGTFLYCIIIVCLDSRMHRRFVISKNMLRYLLDGLTFSTGLTIAMAIWDKTVFSIVASNAVYITVTSFTCILGPLINLGDRYGRTVD